MDHLSTHRKFLYDVDGNILVDKNHRVVNIYRNSFNEALEKKEVRIFRNKTMSELCYRYFITSQEQLDRFLEERRFGSNEGPNKKYHVYVDEDCDKNSPVYKSLFCNSLYG